MGNSRDPMKKLNIGYDFEVRGNIHFKSQRRCT